MRLLRRAAIALAALVVVLAAGIAATLWMTLPATRATARIPGLAAPVDIAYDADGIPHIRAASRRDAAAAIGYVHARDRMFQMDLMRRVASGRIAELAGPSALPMDRFMRTLGFVPRAEADLAELPAATRAMLDAYARGVNAWIAERGRLAAPEFLVLGRPAPWTAIDCLLWGKTLGLWLSGDYRSELTRLALAGHLSPDLIRELWPADHETGIPSAALSPTPGAARLAASLPSFPDPFTLPRQASNEWAVDGRHSATGAPLLAGDPHLAFGQPGIWYLARIDTPNETLAGATSPGVPYLVIGRNAHIAWTFTTTGADVQDVFIETPIDADHYQTPTGPAPYTERREIIHVRGAKDETLIVRETRHGPVLSDPEQKGRVLAVAMANLAPHDSSATGLQALDEATDVASAGRAGWQISAPAQNLLVADPHHIGLFMTGRIPLRRAGDGSAPVAGADGAHDWTGYAGGALLPYTIDPPSGRLVNANERVAPPDFPVYLGRDWFGDWRARRIRALLDEVAKPGVADFTAMQMDVHSAYMDQLLPTLRAVPPQPGLPGAAQSLLLDWDGTISLAAPQPLIVDAWLTRFVADVLARNHVPEADAGPRHEFTAYVLSPAGAHWCGGNCAPLLAASLAPSLVPLAARFGDDPRRWHWGEAHEAVFAHPILARLPLLGPLTTARIPVPGDNTTIDVAGTFRGGFDALHGPSYRGVYDLADLDRSRFIVAPGQSGNPLSRHATDFITRWRDGDTITLLAEPRHVAATLRLVP